MKVFIFQAGILLFLFPGCQRSNSDSSKLDSLKLDSARLADSLANIAASVQGAPSQPYYDPEVLTLHKVMLAEDSVLEESAETVEGLTPVKILDQTKTFPEDCGAYIYKVQLPDLRTGWILGSSLAFPSQSFLASTPVSLNGMNYNIFSLTQGGEITGQECGSAWMVLVFSHSENKIYPITIIDAEITEDVMRGLRMQSGAATLEFYSDMAYPGITDVQVNDNLIELVLRIGYMDNTFSLYRLFLEKSDNAFHIIRHVMEAEPDYGGGN